MRFLAALAIITVAFTGCEIIPTEGGGWRVTLNQDELTKAIFLLDEGLTKLEERGIIDTTDNENTEEEVNIRRELERYIAERIESGEIENDIDTLIDLFLQEQNKLQS